MSSGCVNSGFCCKQSPCPFGEKDERGWCKHLKEMKWEGNTPRYLCGIADFISEQPGADLCPAFGAGCSSTLFNTDRDSIKKEMKDGLYTLLGTTKGHPTRNLE